MWLCHTIVDLAQVNTDVACTCINNGTDQQQLYNSLKLNTSSRGKAETAAAARKQNRQATSTLLSVGDAKLGGQSLCEDLCGKITVARSLWEGHCGKITVGSLQCQI